MRNLFVGDGTNPGAFTSLKGLIQSYTGTDGLLKDNKDRLSDQAILDFTYITMTYALHAVMSVALRTEFDDRADPIVEVAAPEGQQAANIGRAISGRDDAQ